MAIANDEPAPKWRNLAAWSGVGAGFYVLTVWGALLLNGKGVGATLDAMFRSSALAATLGLGLIVSMAAFGFSSRKRPLSLRTFRNSLIWYALAIGSCLLVVRGFSAFARAGALRSGASDWAAAIIGSTLVILAFLGTFATASAHTGAGLIDDEAAAEEMRERGRLFLYSFIWMAACGALLIVLALAGHAGLLSPAAALAGALALVAVLIVLGIAAWRLNDELGRTLSLETGHMAFYLILALGGGWAMLAHLGFVAGPAPIDWLTLFIVLMFAAAFIAAGRRNLLTR